MNKQSVICYSYKINSASVLPKLLRMVMETIAITIKAKQHYSIIAAARQKNNPGLIKFFDVLVFFSKSLILIFCKNENLVNSQIVAVLSLFFQLKY